MPRPLTLALWLLLLWGCTPALRVGAPPLPAPWQEPDAYLPGNAVTILATGGETYEAMQAAIRSAQRHIHVETYILCDDNIGRALLADLAERRRAGVEVRILYDAQGSHNCTSTAFFEKLENQGLEIAAYRPASAGPLIYPFYFNRRDHRKLLIIDGRIAFTGGINFNDVYAATPAISRENEEYWRDTNVQVEGPAVAAFQRLFLEHWRKHRPLPDFPGEVFFPHLPPQGEVAVQLLESEGGARRNPLYETYLAAFRHASERIWITQAYLSPEPNLLEALTSAAQRGVDVRLIMPHVSDLPLLKPMADSTYETLLSAGVRIYERPNAYMHAKTAVIDGRWSTVGSINLDYRSLVHNDEVNLLIDGREFAQRMEALFREDLSHSVEIELEQWRQRPLWPRVKEWLGRLVAYWI